MSRIPENMKPALERLREYMKRMYPGRDFPVEFWKISDDDLFFEALGYLPLQMTEESERLDALAEGYRLAYPIFWIEDDYWVNGWTALTNAGVDLLPWAISAYQRIGMDSEAQALQAALESIRRAPQDEHAAEAAYKAIPNRFDDDEIKNAKLLEFFRQNSHMFEVGDAYAVGGKEPTSVFVRTCAARSKG